MTWEQEVLRAEAFNESGCDFCLVAVYSSC